MREGFSMATERLDDFKINSSIKSIMVRHQIDTSLVRATSVGGTVYVNGVISLINEGWDSVSANLMECVDLEIKEIAGVKWVNYYLDNIINIGGKWQHVSGRKRGSSGSGTENKEKSQYKNSSLDEVDSPEPYPRPASTHDGYYGESRDGQSGYQQEAKRSSEAYSPPEKNVSDNYFTSPRDGFTEITHKKDIPIAPNAMLGNTQQRYYTPTNQEAVRRNSAPQQDGFTEKMYPITGGNQAIVDNSNYDANNVTRKRYVSNYGTKPTTSSSQSALGGATLSPIGDLENKDRLFRARLVISDSYTKESIFLYSRAQIYMGRNAIDNDGQDICLRPKPVSEKARRISGRHLSLFVENNNAFIMDLGSSQTSLDDILLDPFAPRTIFSAHRVDIASTLELKVERVSPDPFPITIEGVGTVNNVTPAVFIERVKNREEHAYAMIPGKLRLGIDEQGALRPNNSGSFEIFSFAGFLWARGGGMPDNTCQPLLRGQSYTVDGNTIKVGKVRPEHMK